MLMSYSLSQTFSQSSELNLKGLNPEQRQDLKMHMTEL